MIIKFPLYEYDDVIGQIHETEYYNQTGPYYKFITKQKIENSDDDNLYVEYYALQFRVVVPALKLSFREGLCGYCNDYESQEESINLYDENEKDPTKVLDIYSNVSIDYLLYRKAEKEGINDDLECYMDTEEFDPKHLLDGWQYESDSEEE